VLRPSTVLSTNGLRSKYLILFAFHYKVSKGKLHCTDFTDFIDYLSGFIDFKKKIMNHYKQYGINVY
jgi:hypothetical protein